LPLDPLPDLMDTKMFGWLLLSDKKMKILSNACQFREYLVAKNGRRTPMNFLAFQ